MSSYDKKLPPVKIYTSMASFGPVIPNANDVIQESLKPLDRLALNITRRVGSMSFFFVILAWTLVWTGYNFAASEFPGLHWRSFDPFPAFVAYLLISNVIQILLMPLIMVGQNVQSRHFDTRAELDYAVNQKAEREVQGILEQQVRHDALVEERLALMEKRILDAINSRPGA